MNFKIIPTTNVDKTSIEESAEAENITKNFFDIQSHIDAFNDLKSQTNRNAHKHSLRLPSTSHNNESKSERESKARRHQKWQHLLGENECNEAKQHTNGIRKELIQLLVSSPSSNLT
ncbi:CLUMA_CG008209, isoform A [Clunio marinus]|uniref:CLUMA_CG008209, isoform A n=1 Tax=Clunio marinus TaxID=568069 RepID=A0A1J1I340_9DIPT|nr:CLUMA_CG008209, isoform A [Clunio marinus]